MIAQITRKISDTDKRRLDREETIEEMKKVVNDEERESNRN